MEALGWLVAWATLTWLRWWILTDLEPVTIETCRAELGRLVCGEHTSYVRPRWSLPFLGFAFGVVILAAAVWEDARIKD